MALQSHLLQACILYPAPAEGGEETNANQQVPPPRYTPAEPHHQLQKRVLNLAAKVFSGAYEVRESPYVSRLAKLVLLTIMMYDSLTRVKEILSRQKMC